MSVATRLVGPMTGPTTELFGCLVSDVFRRPGRARCAFPVLLIPGLGLPEGVLCLMRAWLGRAGHPVAYAGTAPMLRCSEELTAVASGRCEALANRHELPVIVIGHSRGGQIARVLSARFPASVAGVVTLGTPGTRTGLNPGVMVPVNALAALRRVGLRGLPSQHCLAGTGCCEKFTAELKAVDHAPPLRVLWSARDEVVPPDSRLRAIDPADERRVNASHTGMLANAHVYREIRAAIAEFGDAARGPEADLAVGEPQVAAIA